MVTMPRVLYALALCALSATALELNIVMLIPPFQMDYMPAVLEVAKERIERQQVLPEGITFK